MRKCLTPSYFVKGLNMNKLSLTGMVIAAAALAPVIAGAATIKPVA